VRAAAVLAMMANDKLLDVITDTGRIVVTIPGS
jgi:hypothetical protein